MTKRITKADLEAQVAALQAELDLYKRAYEHVTASGITQFTEGWGGRTKQRYMSPAQARSNSLGWAQNQINKESA